MYQGKFKKLATRVEEALSQESLFVEPKQIDPSLMLVAPTNRDGAPHNAQHVHYGILKSFMTKGFDRTTFAIGIWNPQPSKARLVARALISGQAIVSAESTNNIKSWQKSVAKGQAVATVEPVANSNNRD